MCGQSCSGNSALQNNEAKSYLGAPEPYDAVTDNWTAYVQRFIK